MDRRAARAGDEQGPRKLLGFEPRLPAKAVRALVVVCLAIGAYFLPIEGLSEAGMRMLAIFVIAAGFWVTEVVDPYATAILAVALQVVLLGLPGGPLGFEGSEYTVFFKPIASPVIALFFGGFVLALAASKYGLDRILAGIFLKPFAKTLPMLLLGIIGVTALFSMWMSNTATTAMMLAIVAPVAAGAPEVSRVRPALILSVAFAANLGGMGTLIGTPPNAIAAMALSGAGMPVTFLQWMIVGLPIAICTLALLWGFLCLYVGKGANLEGIEFAAPSRKLDWRMVIIMGTFLVTVVGWMTEPLHGIPASITALLPVIVFTFLPILKPTDLSRLDWTVLILVAGGMSLGEGMQLTGLSDYFVASVPIAELHPFVGVLALGVVATVLSNFMSNSASAALLVPLSLQLAPELPLEAALAVAFCASAAMSLPVSTPPNAIAFSSGLVTGNHFKVLGTMVTALSLVVIAVAMLILTLAFG